MIKLPHHWVRPLTEGSAPAYQAIAELIAEDLRNGRLMPRDRLPTLRVLAQLLGVNYTTAARGYAEAHRRGLIDTRVGAGTFVRGAAPTLPLRGGSGAEMTMNLPPEPADPVLLGRMRASMEAALAAGELADLLRYQDFGGTAPEREVAAGWLHAWVPGCTPDQVLVAPGIQGVLAALLSQLARPGDLVCTETLTYPGIKAIAAQFGIRLYGLPMDEEGVSSRAFEEACRKLQPRALYLNPTVLNPTTQSISAPRREALADIAAHHSVPIIEDDAYGMLPGTREPALATFAPGLTYYVSGLAKCYGAGLRTAFVRAPGARAAQRLAGSLRATTVMASPLTTAIALQALRDGTAAAVLQAVRAESRARQALAATLLTGSGHQAHADAFHLWLPVPAQGNPTDFAASLRAQGVAVVAAAAFSTDADPPPAVRVCLGGPGGRPACGAALRRVAQALGQRRRTGQVPG